MTERKEINSKDLTATVAFCMATVLLIPLGQWILGGLAWVLALILVLRSPSIHFRRRFGVLLAMIMLLAIAPINTDRSNENFLILGSFFLAAIFIPAFVFRWWGPGIIEWRFWPRTFRWRDVIYVAISIPIGWYLVQLYFFTFTPDLAQQWPMPKIYSEEAKWRLVIGINLVGIWDELFFVNVVYATMRSVLPARIANPAQAVVYTAVLYDMAFIGAGPILVYLFALTQGGMYESSRNLLWVLIVHLIVDAFLVVAIMQYYYPDRPMIFH
ncbi:MAG: CPBP family glutamic-type intramembrane protease [Verrucomicrobiota bacterium]